MNSLRVKIPTPFVERMEQQMGSEEATALVGSLDGESPTSIRLNRFKQRKGSNPLSNYAPTPIGWSEDGYYLSERPSFTYESAFHAGAYYVQEASSQFLSHLLASSDKPWDGATILDCCAAPGGKSTLYSSVVGSEGLVVASELNRSRASALADNIRKWGVGNVVVANCDAKHHSEFESFYDLVAIDAPCSGEGMFRKSPNEGGARSEWSVDAVAMCATRQLDILQSVWSTLKSGGAMIYSTCTFNREENEGVLEQFTEWCNEGEIAPYERITLDDSWGVVRSEVGAFQCFRFMPHRSRGEGFFVAVARKSFDVSNRLRMPKSRKKIFAPLGRKDIAECRRWVQEPTKMSFLLVHDSVYGYYTAQEERIKRLSETLNVIYSGVEMGQMIKGKLNPDGALALFASLNREAAAIATLPADEMIKYLRKEECDTQLFSEGLNIVCDELGYAVGFAKRIKNRVNNRYLNSLRILK